MMSKTMQEMSLDELEKKFVNVYEKINGFKPKIDRRIWVQKDYKREIRILEASISNDAADDTANERNLEQHSTGDGKSLTHNPFAALAGYRRG